MSELPGVVSLVATILGIAGLLAAAAAIFRVTSLRSTINDQAVAIVGLRERVGVSEEEERRAKERITILEKEVEHLKETRDSLAQVVTGKVELEQLLLGQEQILALLAELRKP